ncbi:MAG: zinc ribbon domain-containing protein [Pseudomonadota bacterium]
MPLFEYACKNCNQTFELLVMGRDVPQCPSCSSQDLDKLMSRCGFVTKSSGAGEFSAPSASSSSCSGCAGTSCSTCGSR